MAAAEGPDARLTLRAHPRYWRFWTAETISGFGSYVTTLALQWLIVTTLGAGSAAVGVVNGARWLPYLALGFVAGAVIDRMPRRPVLVLADAVRALILIAVSALALAGALSIPGLMALMCGFGLVSLFADAAGQSYVPRLVPRDLVPTANARIDQSASVAQGAGPGLAGLLIRLMSAPLAILVDAISYAVSAVLVLSAPTPEPPRPREPLAQLRREIADGLRWVYRQPKLAALAIDTHGWFLCHAAALAVLTPYAAHTLGFGALTLGLTLAVGGVGALVGSLCAVRAGIRYGAGPVIIGCRGADAVGWAILAISPVAGAPGWLVFGAGQLVLGFSAGLSNTNELSYRQLATPDRLQGRTNAIMRSGNRAMIVIGAPIGGFIGEAIGYRALLSMIAVGFVVVAGSLAATRFRGAQLNDPPPDLPEATPDASEE